MEREIFMNLLKGREYRDIREALIAMNAADIAVLLSELEDRDLAIIFRLIPKDKAADVFSEMNSSMKAYLVEIFTDKERKELLSNLFLDDTVDLLEDLPANLVTHILDSVGPEKREQINLLLSYPDDSAGSVMTTEYVDLRRENTVGDAIRHIRQTGIHKETIYTCYVLEKRRLIGIVSAKDLLTLDENALIGENMKKTEIISVNTHTDQEEVVKVFQKYNFLALPVLDMQGFMVGIVTVDDVMNVMEDEATEDIELMGAVTPSHKTYFETSVLEHARHRIVWLLVLMLSATFTGAIITHYENAIAAVPLLVSFIPMLMDTGGNCGSQSSTLIIRGLALDEIKLKDIFRVMFREFGVAIVVGITLAAANGLRIWIMYRDTKIALVVGLSLIATIILSKLIGCSLPILAKKIHCDPAIMAAPLITTVVDACSVMIYFKFATSLLAI
ncbi:magnesium transporter [Anaerolentibacter hominis]|uniref:magnesium transporter n=1 Tax=Anaerolentibacter hominis TaxID=3079009 RepID=UPI0031B8AED8